MEGNIFSGARINVGTYLDGGGIVGATGPVLDVGKNLTAGINRIADSAFVYNTVTAADGQIMGGLVYSYGLAGGMTIADSIFLGNTFSSNVTSAYGGVGAGAAVYGTVTVDTGVTASPGDNGYHTLTLQSTAGGGVEFEGNTIYENGSPTRTNSLYFGKVLNLTGLKSDGTLSAAVDPPAADAKLIIDAGAGGGVFLMDPILVDQTDGGTGAYTFDMEVLGGDFTWAGDNKFFVDATAPGTVRLSAGYTILAPGFTLSAENHLFDLQSGAGLLVMGDNAMTLRRADLNGNMRFNINPAHVNDETNTMLTISAPKGATSVEGATVKLSNLPASSPRLVAGEKFYLIKTDDTD
jgi:hypothetical protein